MSKKSGVQSEQLLGADAISWNSLKKKCSKLILNIKIQWILQDFFHTTINNIVFYLMMLYYNEEF